MDLDQGLLDFVSAAEKMIPTATEKNEITKVGAKIIQDSVSQSIHDKHYGKGHKGIHLADTVITQAEKGTGNTLVGFNVKDGIDHGRIANFLNNGTIKITADHFYDSAVKAANDEAFRVMANAVKKRGGGE